MLSEEKKKEIVEILAKRVRAGGRDEACPMCGHPNFTIADAYFLNMLHDDVHNVTIGGSGVSIPAVAVYCHNCGFISQHALGALGLLPKKDNEESK